MFYNTELIAHVKRMYPKDTKVRLIHMEDPQAPPVGSIGIVSHVDDIGSIHIHWETGSTLAVVFGVDVLETIL